VKRNRKRSGFTLVELMVVIVIIGLLAGLVGTNVIKNIKKARITTAKAQIKTLEQAVLDYYMDVGQYPDSSIGLDALVEQPSGVENWDTDGYLAEPIVPKDPWHNEYVYYLETSAEGSAKPLIYSMGPDGKDGTDDDVYSIDMEEDEEALDGQ